MGPESVFLLRANCIFAAMMGPEKTSLNTKTDYEDHQSTIVDIAWRVLMFMLSSFLWRVLQSILGPYNRRFEFRLFSYECAFMRWKFRGPDDNLLRHRIDSSQLTVIGHAGSGQFGEVYYGLYKKRNTNKVVPVAMKMPKSRAISAIPNSSNAAINSIDRMSADCLFQEVIQLEYLQHPHIIKAYGVCTNYRDSTGASTNILVMEFASGGNVIDFLRANASRLDHGLMLDILSDVCEAGRHLNKIGIVHRDIGARNVLMHIRGPGYRWLKLTVAKLTDFGLALDIGGRMETNESARRSDRADFHMRYTAPEGFDGAFSSKSDVWSFGVLMWELYELIDHSSSNSESEAPMPYARLNSKHEILEKLCNGGRLRSPNSMPPEMQAIMTSCWEFDPKRRPGFARLASALKSLKRQLKGDHRHIVRPSNIESNSELLELDPPVNIRSDRDTARREITTRNTSSTSYVSIGLYEPTSDSVSHL